MATELWARAMRASERLVEVPVSAVLDGVLVSGTVLVDYKTVNRETRSFARLPT